MRISLELQSLLEFDVCTPDELSCEAFAIFGQKRSMLIRLTKPPLNLTKRRQRSGANLESESKSFNLPEQTLAPRAPRESSDLPISLEKL